MSHCTGALGRATFESTLSDATAAFEKKADGHDKVVSRDEDEKTERKKHKKKKKKKDKKKHEDAEDFETQVAKAMEKQRKDEEVFRNVKDDRKRAYNSISGGNDKELTEAVS